MEIKPKVKLHNVFEVVVTDAETGKVKQKNKAYNTVTNNFFNYVNSATRYICFGSGSGTPAPSDVGMFTLLNSKATTRVESGVEGSTAHATYKIRIEASEHVGANITELGFSPYTGNTYACTHAMIKDSEGHQIAIAKTDVDIIDIYATLYVTLEDLSTKYGGAVSWAALPNDLTNYVLGLTTSISTYQYIYSVAEKVEDTITLMGDVLASPGYPNYKSATVTNDTSVPGLFKRKEVTRINTTEFNGLIGVIGNEILNVRLPGIGLWDPLSRLGYSIGKGDGVTKSFKIPFNDIKPGSLTVYVDGTPVVPTQINDKTYVLGNMKWSEPSRPVSVEIDADYYSNFQIDDEHMIVGTRTGSIKVVNFKTQQVLSTLKIGDSYVPYVQMSKDGTIIVAVCKAIAYVVSFDLNTKLIGTVYTMKNGPISTTHATVTPNGKFLIHSDPAKTTISASSINSMNNVVGEVVTTAGPKGYYAEHIGVSPDGKKLSYVSSDSSGYPHVIDFEQATGTFGAEYTRGDMTWSAKARQIEFTPDGKYLVMAINNYYYSTNSGSPIYEVDDVAKTFKEVRNGQTSYTSGVLLDGDVVHALSSSTTLSFSLTKTGTGTSKPAKLLSCYYKRIYGSSVGNLRPMKSGGLMYMLNYAEEYNKLYMTKYSVRGTTEENHFTLAVAPPTGAVITADFTVDGVPKDVNHILDLEINYEVRPG